MNIQAINNIISTFYPHIIEVIQPNNMVTSLSNNKILVKIMVVSFSLQNRVFCALYFQHFFFIIKHFLNFQFGVQNARLIQSNVRDFHDIIKFMSKLSQIILNVTKVKFVPG